MPSVAVAKRSGRQRTAVTARGACLLHGFTLVELLVVIAIIGVLIALLLPAVQAAREAARRAQCVNNLKQWALAMQNHHDTKKGLPAAGFSTTGLNTGNRQGWPPQLWPFIEEAPLTGRYDFDVSFYLAPNAYPVDHPNPEEMTNAPAAIPIPAYYCPSDYGPAYYKFDFYRVRGNYFVNWGPMVFQPPDPLPTFRAPFGFEDYKSRDLPLRSRFKDFIDGTSNTLLLSEERMHPNEESVDGRGDLLNDVGDGAFMTLYTPNTSIPDAQWSSYCDSTPDVPCTSGGGSGTQREIYSSARSYHPGGVNAAFADGHVEFFSDSVSLAYWQAIGTMNGQETVSDQ